VRVWSADGQGQPLVLTGHTGYVNSAKFSPDGKYIVSAADDQTARVWPADGQGQPLVLTGHTGTVNSAEYSPDGKFLVTGSFDQTVRVWPADGKGSPAVLTGHTGSVLFADFSPDGRRIVSGSRDRTVRVWSDFAIIRPGDPRIWQATNRCLPIEQYVLYFDFSEEVARQCRQRCLDQVRSNPSP